MTIGKAMAAPLNGTQDNLARRWGWLVITLAVLLTYWPLSTFQYTLADGDALNCWLPWRSFITSCLMDGHFPLWNPHQQFGYPMHADLQGPTWYVESLAIGGTIGHSIYTLQALYLLYLIIGGIGMMRLVRTLHNDARIGLVIGVAYALGGFFTGHQMHFYSVISAAWLPWLFAAALRLLREPGWKNAARVALVQGLLLTGGNHTFTIIAGYALFALVVVHTWRRWKTDRWVGVRPILLWGALAVVAAAFIGAGVFHAWWETGPYLSRAGGLTYEAAAVDPVTPRSLISLLFPYGTSTDAAVLGTDAPMGNAYIGVLMLPLALAALFRKRSLVENVLLVAGTICALAALGDLTPVHRWLWSAVPGMDLFRFPAYFRWYTWLAALVLAAGTLRAYWSGELKRGVLEALLGITLLVACITTGLALGHLGHDGASVTFFERMRAIDLHRRIVFSAVVVVPLLLLAVVLAWRRRLSFPLLLGMVLLEMGWNTSLAQWNTAVSDIRPEWLHHRLSALSEGPIIPEMVPTSTYDDNGQRLRYLVHNTHDFLGGFSRNGVNTFWLKNAMSLELEHTALWNAMSQQPVAFLADSIVPWREYSKGSIPPEHYRGLAVLDEGSSITFAKPCKEGDSIEMTEFDRNRFILKTTSAEGALLVLQQSSYPGWETLVDDHPAPLVNVNVAAMGVEVPAGSHAVEFRYHKPIVTWLLALSLVTFLGLLLALAFTTDAGLFGKAGSLVLAGMVGWSLFAHMHRLPRAEDGMNEAVNTLPDNASIVMNDDGSSPMPAQGDMVGWRLRADDPLAVGEAAMVLRAADQARIERAPEAAREVHWMDAALKPDPAVRAMVLDRYEIASKKEIGGTTDLHLAARDHSPEWRTIQVESPALHWLSEASPFGSGCTIPMDSLARDRAGSLVVDLLANAPHEAVATIVFERKLGDRTTDYRTLPIGTSPAWRQALPCYAVLPIDEVYRPGEVLKIYVWSHLGDSLSEQGFRVRVAPRTFYHW